MGGMKSAPSFEATPEFGRFQEVMREVVLVSKAEIDRRVENAKLTSERSNNPNLPLPSAYPTGTTGVSFLRNWNDPNPCPRGP